MSIIHFSINDFITQLPAFAPVPAPIGEPVSQVRVRSESPASAPTSRTGVWECTQGRWQRQIPPSRVLRLPGGTRQVHARRRRRHVGNRHR